MAAHTVGERLSYDGALCTVRYIGAVEGTNGAWLGVEWDDPTRGKHDGQHRGVRYFECKIKSPTSASFVRPTRPHDGKTDFLSALHAKYAAEHETQKQVVISGKVAEEVGFDKISRKQAQLHELKIVILDGMRLVCAYDPAVEKTRSIRDVCPSVVELDLSRNLFTELGPAVEICAELAALRSLRLNGNRFSSIATETLDGAETAFKGIKELAVEETLLDWTDICTIASKFSNLGTLSASGNQIAHLTPIPASPLVSTLTSLNLEFNDLTSLSDLAPLTALTSLRNLHLKGNRISTILSPYQPPTAPPPIFSPTVHYLDLSSNQVATWTFADALPTLFPGLTSLRFAHNPIYDNPDLDAGPSPSTSTPSTLSSSTETSHMLLAARLPGLRVLNFSPITAQDRTNAEAFYLSRVARELALSPPAREPEILAARHPRFAALCAVHGAPVVVRREGGDDDGRAEDARFLEGRVVRVRFRMGGAGEEKAVRVPRSFDLYAVRGVAGGLFGVSPLGVRLVWETGEWDPVGGFDEDGGGSSDEEELAEGAADVGGFVRAEEKGRPGRWVAREVVLGEGPRLFGYCVDGAEARIRVEVV